MDLLSALPIELQKHIHSSKAGFAPLSMTILFLNAQCDVEETLRRARECEANWFRGLEKHAARLAAAKQSAAQKKLQLKETKKQALIKQLDLELLS